MKKVLYIGIFNSSNIGDLIISNQINRFLCNENNIIVECMDFLSLKEVNYLNNCCQLVKENFHYIEELKKIISKSNFVRYLYSNLLEYLLLNKKYRFYKYYSEIVEKYDVICIGGGNLIMNISNNNWTIKINNIVKIAKEKNKKIFIISVGVGPLLSNKSKTLIKNAFQMVDHITVRDDYSRNILKNELEIDKKIDISGDPALLINYNKNNNKNKSNIKNIAISIMPFGKVNFQNLSHYEDYEYYIKMYSNLIEYFYKRNKNYIFSLFSTELMDYSTIEKLYHHVLKNNKFISKQNLKIEYLNNFQELLIFYHKQDLIIGTRMHSLIIAFTQYLPIMAISWQKKIDGFMKYVKLKRFCYDLNSINKNIGSIYNDAQFLLSSNINNKKRLDEIRIKFNLVNGSILKKLVY